MSTFTLVGSGGLYSYLSIDAEAGLKSTDKILMGIVKNLNTNVNIQDLLIDIETSDLNFPSYPEWVSNISVLKDSEDSRYILIKFNCTENNTGNYRSGIILIKYKDDTKNYALLEITLDLKNESGITYIWEHINYDNVWEQTNYINILLGTSFFTRLSDDPSTGIYFKLHDDNNNLITNNPNDFVLSGDNLNNILTIKNAPLDDAVHSSDNAFLMYKLNNDTYHNIGEIYTNGKILYKSNGNTLSLITVSYLLILPFNILLLMKLKKNTSTILIYADILYDNGTVPDDNIILIDNSSNNQYLIYKNREILSNTNTRPIRTLDLDVINTINENYYDEYMINESDQETYDIVMYLLPYNASYSKSYSFIENDPTCIKVSKMYQSSSSGKLFTQLEIDGNDTVLYYILGSTTNVTNVPYLIYTDLS